MSKSPFPKIGEILPINGEMNKVYCLLLEDHIPTIDPVEYFITSGEANAKIAQLEKDAWAFAGKVRKLSKLLKESRGDAKYLECGWEDGVLILRQKNPKKKKIIEKDGEQDGKQKGKSK